MLKNPTPVRRWKHWLALPLLAAACCVVGRPATAQTAPPAPTALKPGSPAWREVIRRKTRLAQHQDSLRGPFAPGTMPEVQITNMQGPGEPEVTVVRVKKGAPVTEVPGGAAVRVEVNASATKSLPESRKPAVYTYVDQMPQLPGGGGTQALVQAVQRNVVYPVGGTMQGKVFVKFTVQADGSVDDIVVVKSLADVYDRAVVDAIGRLPRLVPGRQGGRPVAVSFTLPVQFAAKP